MKILIVNPLSNKIYELSKVFPVTSNFWKQYKMIIDLL